MRARWLLLLVPFLLAADYVYMDDDTTPKSWRALIVDCDDTTGKFDYNATTEQFECQTDGGGGGGGDNVSVDGVAATDPDFRSEGEIDSIRCTGAGAPDAACLAAEDVIFRITDFSAANDLDAAGDVADDSHNHTTGHSNSFATIGVGTADSPTDTLTVSDSATIDFTTTNDPEDLTAAFLPAGVGSVTWLDNADRTWTFDIGGTDINPSIAFSGDALTGFIDLNADVLIGSGDRADSGELRLLNLGAICWESNPTGTDVCLEASTSNVVSVVSGGTLQANTAAALTANPANCAAGQVSFPTGIAANGVPENCDATPAINGVDFTGITSAGVTAALKTEVGCAYVEDPAVEVMESVWRAPVAVTITEIWCEVDAGSVGMDLQNDDGTPTGVNGSDITCNTPSGTSDTSFAGDATLAQNDRIDLDINTVTTAVRLSVCWRYTYD